MTSFEEGQQKWVEFCGKILNMWGHVEGRIELLSLLHSQTTPDGLQQFRRSPFRVRLETLKKIGCLKENETETILTFKQERDNTLFHNLTTEGMGLRWNLVLREKIMKDAQEALNVAENAFMRHQGEQSLRLKPTH